MKAADCITVSVSLKKMRVFRDIILEGRTGGVSGMVHERKNTGSRITNIKISLSQITKAQGGYLTKFNMWRLRPEVQHLTLLYTILAEKVPLLYAFY